MIQTGCEGVSSDILHHRQMQNMPLTQEDKDGITCPYLFRYPCSPHLAAEMENITIDTHKIAEASRLLAEKYDYVLLEGRAVWLCLMIIDIPRLIILRSSNYR
ncbi:dithiobiotin synthetase [Actinobacillus equuli]|nr:dithiobiotin synthetase [Actinobacillus equuli]